MESDDTKALHWSCCTPVTCGESFFLIGQMIQLTRELLEPRFRLRTASRVGYRTHARGIDAVFLDQMRCLVSVTHRLVFFALGSLAWRVLFFSLKWTADAGSWLIPSVLPSLRTSRTRHDLPCRSALQPSGGFHR